MCELMLKWSSFSLCGSSFLQHVWMFGVGADSLEQSFTNCSPLVFYPHTIISDCVSVQRWSQSLIKWWINRWGSESLQEVELLLWLLKDKGEKFTNVMVKELVKFTSEASLSGDFFAFTSSQHQSDPKLQLHFHQHFFSAFLLEQQEHSRLSAVFSSHSSTQLEDFLNLQRTDHQSSIDTNY